MATRGQSGIEPRFVGENGRRRLAEALKAQTLVSGETALATALLKIASNCSYMPGDCLTTQGASDN